MTNVWFIRHGESTANIGGATRTAEEAYLTERGRREAKAVAEYLKASNMRLSRIISSRYIRALQTAQATQKYFPCADFAIRSVHEFDYLTLPRDVLTTSAERSPLVKKFWDMCDPFYRDREKAESFADFIGRVKHMLLDLQGYNEDKLIVIFSHYQFIQAVRWLLQSDRYIDTSRLKKDEMRDFFEFLDATYIHNGAVLKTFLSQRERYVWPDIETAHLSASASEAKLLYTDVLA